MGVTSLADSIYAVGGLDGTRPLATVERFSFLCMLSLLSFICFLSVYFTNVSPEGEG